MLDELLKNVNYWLEDEFEPNAVYVEIDGYYYIAFTINTHPLIYEPIEIVFYGMKYLEERDNWHKY